MVLGKQYCSTFEGMFLSRLVEDFAVVYFGDTLFKALRLAVLGASSVHFFACIFYRVKILSAKSEEDVIAFYNSRDIDENVSLYFLLCFTEILKYQHFSLGLVWADCIFHVAGSW